MVYLVRQESGQYSDYLSIIEAAFSTRERAVAYIESKTETFLRTSTSPAVLEETWNGEEDDGVAPDGEIVTLSPTPHPSYRNGQSWYFDGDCTLDNYTWFIDELEVDKEEVGDGE